MMNWNITDSASNAMNYTFDTSGVCDYTANYITLTDPDPLIDWLPNSCLYTKYVPTWHLVRSYK